MAVVQPMWDTIKNMTKSSLYYLPTQIALDTLYKTREWAIPPQQYKQSVFFLQTVAEETS